jgi:hypothetical protein
VEVRKTALRDRDWLQRQAGVAVNLGLLAVEAGTRPGGDIIGEFSPDKPGRHQTLGCEMLCEWEKMCFLNFSGMNCRASAALLRSNFAWQP